jgi:hypothetical protein
MTDPIVIDLRNATPAETEQAFLDIRQHLCAETLFTGAKPKPNMLPHTPDERSPDDMIEVLGQHARSVARVGMTMIGTDLDMTANMIDQLMALLEESRNTVQRLLGEIEDRNLTIRELTSEVRSLRYALTGASEPGDAERIRQAQDDFSADEGEPGTDDL